MKYLFLYQCLTCWYSSHDTFVFLQEKVILSDILSGCGSQFVECHTIQVTPSGDFGFMAGRDSDDQVIVKHVAEGQPLRQGDK